MAKVAQQKIEYTHLVKESMKTTVAALNDQNKTIQYDDTQLRAKVEALSKPAGFLTNAKVNFEIKANTILQSSQNADQAIALGATVKVPSNCIVQNTSTEVNIKSFIKIFFIDCF